MRLVSWNVAGFRAVLKKGFDDFFESINADVFCIQESKVTNDQFDYLPEGYMKFLYPAEKKGYSGTLVYSRVKPLNVTYGMGIEEHDHEGRIITLEFNDFFLVNVYVPNVKRELSRLDYRMIWEDDFRAYLKDLEQVKPVIICGDFNKYPSRCRLRKLLKCVFFQANFDTYKKIKERYCSAHAKNGHASKMELLTSLCVRLGQARPTLKNDCWR